MYKCVTVVAYLYTCTGKEIDTKIGTEIWRYGTEQEAEKIHPKCLLSGVCWLVGLLWFGLVWFGLVRWFGSDFCTSIKKFFNFPNFFRNCLIFNAFQI